MNVTSQGYFTSQYLHTHPEWSHGPDDERGLRRRPGAAGDGYRGLAPDSARVYDAYPHGNVAAPPRTPSPSSPHVGFAGSPEPTSFNTAHTSPAPSIPPTPHYPASPSLGRPFSKQMAPSSPQPRSAGRQRPAPSFDPDALDEEVTPADLASRRWAATKKARRRQQSTVSNVLDPDYLEMGITPADLHYLNAEAQRHERLERGGWGGGGGDLRRDRRWPTQPAPLSEYDHGTYTGRELPHDTYDDRYYGYGGDRATLPSRAMAGGARVTSSGSHHDGATALDGDGFGDGSSAPAPKGRPWSGYYINQKERYDAAADVKPYMYTHKTLREVFQNKQEPNSHYNPMEYVFDQKNPGKVKRAVDTVKHKLGKDDYKNYDYFEMRRAQLKKQDEARQAALAAEGAEEARLQGKSPDFHDATSRTPSPSAAPLLGNGDGDDVSDDGSGDDGDGDAAHEPGVAAADAIYNAGHERKPNSFKHFVNKFKVAKWESTAWDHPHDDRGTKATSDTVFDTASHPDDAASPQSPSHHSNHPPSSSSSIPTHPATTPGDTAGDSTRCSTPPGNTDQPSASPTKSFTPLNHPEASSAKAARAPSVIPRPDLESIASEYTTASTPAHASPTSSVGDSDADDPLHPLVEEADDDLSLDVDGDELPPPSVPAPVVVSTTPQRPSYKPQIMAKWPRGTSWGDDEPPAPKPKKPLFGNLKLKYKPNANTKWDAAGGKAPSVRSAAPSMRSAKPGSIRSVRTKGASTVITVDADGHSHVSRELVLNPHTNELEPPTSMSSMLHGEPPTAGPAVAGGGGGGVWTLIQTKLGPVLAKVPALNDGLNSARGAVGPMVSSVGPYVQQAHPTNFTNRLRSFEFIQKAFRPLDDIAARYPLLTLPIHIVECFFFLWMMWEASKLLDILYRIVKIVLAPFHVLGQAVYKS